MGFVELCLLLTKLGHLRDLTQLVPAGDYFYRHPCALGSPVLAEKNQVGI